MTAYRAGQRVRIEWPNGSAVEGTVSAEYDDTLEVGPSGGRNFPALYDLAFPRNRTVTVLSEPRPAEPTGLGAVVEAMHATGNPRHEERHLSQLVYMAPAHLIKPVSPWRCATCDARHSWGDLIDPVVLSEGWIP